MEPNPPVWPASVTIFDRTSVPSDIATAVQTAFGYNGGDKDHGQFSDKRFAFLFGPGEYSTDVPVGYYTQILGLGESPDDTVFTGDMGVYSEEGNSDFTVGALNSFWRSAENFRTKAAHNWILGSGMMWAGSQMCPLRRVHVDNQLILFEYKGGDAAGFASGGFLADSKVDGSTVSGSQQQWFTRNSNLGGGFEGGVWNTVFSGVLGAPEDHCGNLQTAPVVTTVKTPLIAEKPFITMDPAGQFHLNIPQAQVDAVGTSWENAGTPKAQVNKVDFSHVYVTQPTDTAAVINHKLASGLHVVVTPAIYKLTEPIFIGNPNTVLLCIGLATLKSMGGNETIIVGDVDGVRVGGCLLEAGPNGAPSLLRWGSGYQGNPANPGFLHDIPTRAGGPDPLTSSMSSDVMVIINNDHVVGDNLWLWRADHTIHDIVKNGDNPVLNGLVIKGADVKMYGLAVEHVLNDGVRWEGNNGMTIFFQCELPYDVTQQEFGDKGYVGYRVESNVTKHTAIGAGVYSFFRDYTVQVQSGIVCPSAVEVVFKFPFTRFLSGSGGIAHVINDNGASVDKKSAGPVYQC